MSVDLSRFLSMFFQETEEHLTAMEALLLALDPKAPDPEALNSLFRAAHSVKGNSAIFGATHFADIMHRIETLLDLIRKRDLQADDEVISAVLQACDGVREELRRLKDHGESNEQALQEVYQRLTALTTRHAVATPPAGAAEPAPARSARFRVEVTAPAGEGITALPLAGLYATLGVLGRVEDVQMGSAAGGAATLSLFLLTAAGEQEVRDKLSALLEGGNVRVEPHEPLPRVTRASALPPPVAPEVTQYGTFSAEATTVFGRPGSRRAGDRESTSATFGRRATDRLVLDRSSIRVDVDKVDRLLNLVGELVIAHSMLAEASERSSAAKDPRLRQSVSYVGRQTRELQDAVMSVRLLPLEVLFSRMPRLVRDLAQRLGKQVELVTRGGETELDKEMIEKLADPLTHLVRNSIAHGIEASEVREAAGKPRNGTIRIEATHQTGNVVVTIKDDGSGFDRDKILRKAQLLGLAVHNGMTDDEVWELVFVPGFSTADSLSDVSGRGIGMDVVRGNIRALGGQIDIQSRKGSGTDIVIRLPLTLAIMEGVSVDIGGETFIIPLSFICEAFLPRAEQIKSIASGPHVVELRDSYLPVLALERLLGRSGAQASSQSSIAVVVEVDGRRAALAIDRLLGQQQFVIKSLESNYRRVPGIAGATVMGNGKIALILDVNALMRLELTPIKNAEELA